MKQKILPYLLLAPMMLIMGVLVFYPIAATFSYSLKKWKLTAPGDIRFIGFDNYKNILKSESFWYSLQNTLFLLVLVVVATSILGSARVALSEHSGERGGNSSGCCGTSVGAAALCEWNFVEICISFRLWFYE